MATRSYYSATVAEFLRDDAQKIVGALAQGYAQDHQDLKKDQTESWTGEIATLKEALTSLSETANWRVCLEFKIPRRQKRIDAVLVGPCVFVLEFKVGEKNFPKAGIEQVEDYTLDLRDFHEGSKSTRLIPILIATEATVTSAEITPTVEQVSTVMKCGRNQLRAIISARWPLDDFQEPASDWESSAYRPVPTIIEAAKTIYGRSESREVFAHSAGKNLTSTAEAILAAIRDAQSTGKKTICFVTGVPGAGKTLAGLNLIHNRLDSGSENHLGVFLSGNGPLVKVLTGALAQDGKKRFGSKKEARRKVSAFLQNVHVFVSEYDAPESVPPDRVIVFDEAQRAWDLEQSRKKFGRSQSEPEHLLQIMGKIPGWAVIVALVGGGQEINTGEAGLPEWGRALSNKFRDWKIWVSPELKTGAADSGQTLFPTGSETTGLDIVEHTDLHLRTTLRSFRSEKLSDWVSALLDNKTEEAKKIAQSGLLNDFPLGYCRSLDILRSWLRKKRRGERRSGIVASSGARRLKAEGIDVKSELKEEEWFLMPSDDIRSSSFLESIGTEFATQGLELDWSGVCWDLDFMRSENAWKARAFRGTKWQSVQNERGIRYAKNKYRVLLTRAREGMLIYIPKGDSKDQTRPPAEYDAIANHLSSCGLSEIS